MSDDVRQTLNPDGDLVGETTLNLDEIRRLYAAMVSARVYDHKASAMQRQGRLATYASFEGQEACQIGSVAPLTDDDWLVGTYRDAGAMWFHGYTWRNLILGRTGDERGGQAPDGVR
ncbi:MAG: pyruvate dehydrogenase (acetyl-transferring) E1 component subunit alpha, partial [Acidimicrobiia bacterium]|nr:pyruvate dehydrogenase (acetyl-transferring) E1 component subunit alpha [Acidimicrobiia bacterium]